MKFNPTDAGDSTKPASILPDGDYLLAILDAEERVSSSGNPMVELTIGEATGKGRRFWDYLVSTPAALWKVKQFMEAAGLEDDFKRGQVDASALIGLIVPASVTTQESDGYPPKNSAAWGVDGMEPTRVKDIDAARKAFGLDPIQTAHQPHAHPSYAGEVAKDDIPF